ncbi:MAG: hypothetical protein ABSF73_08035 [Terriglobia bacterium]|jgi:hypothetical protein
MQTEQSITLSEAQQKRVWEGWLSAEIRGCYFAELVSGYRSKQRGFTWVILVCSSGAAIAIASHWPAWWPKFILVLITTGISLWLLIQRYEDRALKSSDLHVEWNRIANGYRDIWENVYAEDAEQKLRALSEQELSASKNGLDIPDDDKRLLKWQQYVESQHGAT